MIESKWKTAVFPMLLLILMASTRVQAQDYPSRPVTLVVPFGVGTVIDLTARYFSNDFGQRLGQKFIVENRQGNAAVRSVKGAGTDGHMLLWDSSAATIRQVLQKNPDFDVRTDLVPISLLLRGSLGFFVSASSPYRSMKDVIDYARKNPGKMNYGTGGVGTALHLYTELFKQRANLDILQIAYRGGPATTSALAAGDIHLLLFDIPPIVNQTEKFRLLALTAKQRSPYYPDVPTIVESGGPELEAGFWVGMFAPANTPQPIVAKLNAAARSIIQAPHNVQYLQKLSYIPVGSTQDEFSRTVAGEIEQWASVVKLANIPKE